MSENKIIQSGGSISTNVLSIGDKTKIKTDSQAPLLDDEINEAPASPRASHDTSMLVDPGHVELSLTKNKNVFIIHGHDETRLLELEKILKEDFHLQPIILKYQPDGGATTIIEKFENYALQCGYAIALFTPDDQVEKDGKFYLQARPNVIYELGWFSAKLSRRKILLILKQNTEIFSDFQGVIQKVFRTEVKELYKDLLIEFKMAGLL